MQRWNSQNENVVDFFLENNFTHILTFQSFNFLILHVNNAHQCAINGNFLINPVFNIKL